MVTLAIWCLLPICFRTNGRSWLDRRTTTCDAALLITRPCLRYEKF